MRRFSVGQILAGAIILALAAAALYIAYATGFNSGSRALIILLGVGAAIGILSSYIFTKPYKGWHLRAESDRKYFGFRIHREF